MNSLKPDCFYNLGNAHCVKENYKDALRAFKKCIELDAANSAAIYNLGNTYFVMGEQDKAAKYFEKAIEMEPDNYEWRNYIGGLYLE